MRRWTVTLAAVLALPAVVASPAGARADAERGSFVARAVPFPAMEANVYYPQKGSCLGGIEGIHKVSEPFRARTPGVLEVQLEGLSGDWDVYVLGEDNERLAASEKAQVLEEAEGRERVTVAVKRNQQVQMAACNWLGEPEVTVDFEFDARKTQASGRRADDVGSATRRTTHYVDAIGGPVTPFWEWDPDELSIVAGDRVAWRNESGSGHHVTPYGGPWKKADSMHLPVGGQIDFVFRKPGEYLYRCDFAFAGIEHSVLVGDECIGMCGRITVTKRR